MAQSPEFSPTSEEKDLNLDHEEEIVSQDENQTPSNIQSGVPQIRELQPYDGELALECDGLANKGAWILTAKLMEKKQECAASTSNYVGLDIIYKKMLQNAPPLRMAEKNLDIRDYIGAGGYGKVYRADMRTSHKHKKYAVKIVNGAKNVSETYKERDILIMLQHKRVVHLEGVFHQGMTFFVMELCYGSVSSLYSRMEDPNKVRCVVHLLEGLEWIHSRGIIHCDIRPDNLLINDKNLLVIADFGSAQLVNGEEMVKSNKNLGVAGYQDLAANDRFIYSKSSDIFSAACSIFEMMTGQYFLRYRPDVSARHYVDAIRLGRVLNVNVNEDLENEKVDQLGREQLSARATKDKVFGELLVKMTREQGRITAGAAVTHSSVLVAKAMCCLTPEMLDNYTEASQLITQQFPKNTTARYQKREALVQYNTIEKALSWIYYDAQASRGIDINMPNQPFATRPNDSTITGSNDGHTGEITTFQHATTRKTVVEYPNNFITVLEVQRLIETACCKLNEEINNRHKRLLEIIKQSGRESKFGIENMLENKKDKQKETLISKNLTSGGENKDVQKEPCEIEMQLFAPSYNQIEEIPIEYGGEKIDDALTGDSLSPPAVRNRMPPPPPKASRVVDSKTLKPASASKLPTVPFSSSRVVTPTEHSREVAPNIFTSNSTIRLPKPSDVPRQPLSSFVHSSLTDNLHVPKIKKVFVPLKQKNTATTDKVNPISEPHVSQNRNVTVKGTPKQARTGQGVETKKPATTKGKESTTRRGGKKRKPSTSEEESSQEEDNDLSVCSSTKMTKTNLVGHSSPEPKLHVQVIPKFQDQKLFDAFATNDIRTGQRSFCATKSKLTEINQIKTLKARPVRCPGLRQLLEKDWIKKLESNYESGLEIFYVNAVVGKGVRATRTFHEHEFVVEYKGVLLTAYDGIMRYNDPHRKGNYMLRLGVSSKSNWVDATDEANSNIARFINHADKPNCVLKMTSCGTRGFLVTLKKIKKGTEIRYHYGVSQKELGFVVQNSK